VEQDAHGPAPLKQIKLSDKSLFCVKLELLREEGFLLSNRWRTSSGVGEVCWIEDRAHRLDLAMSEFAYTALMFSNAKSSEAILIVIGRNTYSHLSEPGISVLICNKNDLPEKVVQPLSRRQLFAYDRTSKPLEDGRSVLASIQSGVQLGLKGLYVEVQIDPEGSLPWQNPVPACINA
jgi:hypothetical protein